VLLKTGQRQFFVQPPGDKGVLEGHGWAHPFRDFLLTEAIYQMLRLDRDVPWESQLIVFLKLLDVGWLVVAFLIQRVIAGQHLIHNHSGCECVSILSVGENLVGLLWWLV